jgi:predicted nucleic acid-binding Zn ribbon protein
MKKAGDLLQNFLDEKIMNKAKEYSTLYSSWAVVAGDQCASHSKISDLKGTLLIVEADHPGWVQILQTRQTELLKSIQRRTPDLTITGISFKLAKESNQTEHESLSKKQTNTEIVQNIDEETPQEEVDITHLYDKIHDEDFKEALRRLEESIKTRRKQ